MWHNFPVCFCRLYQCSQTVGHRQSGNIRVQLAHSIMPESSHRLSRMTYLSPRIFQTLSTVWFPGIYIFAYKLTWAEGAHLSRRLLGELIVYPCSGVRPSSTISNMNTSATSGLIIMKFYQKHHWDGGKAATGFGPDQIKTLVSMATDSVHRFIMEKTVLPLFLSCFSSDPFYTCR